MKILATVFFFATAFTCAADVVVKNHATGAVLATPWILPDVPAGDGIDVAIDIVNTGTSVITVQSATVAGLYYSLCCDSGFVLQPGEAHTLTLRFAPQSTGYFTGALEIDTLSVFLFARSQPAASLFVATAAGPVQAHAGVPLIVTLDSSFTGQLACVLDNQTAGPVTVNSVSAAGDWSVSSAPPLPLTLQPGQTVPLTLGRAASPAKTDLSGILTVDQWSYAIESHPPEPAIHIQVPGTSLDSGQQIPLAISFDAAPATATTGTVELSLHTDTPIKLIDPAILFTGTGTTTAQFASVPGQLTASFSGAQTVTLQTGTTQGTLHVHAKWGYEETSLDIHLAPKPVVIESVTAKRQAHALDVIVSGFDNTRTAGRLSFSFFNKQGAFIGDPITADSTELFYDFFFGKDYNAGGVFRMDAQFPVTGDPEEIAAVQVDMSNNSGDAQSSVTNFQ